MYMYTIHTCTVHVSIYLRRLPDYACKFLEICLMVCADHGPAVSGAHNTIVTARAGKDLVSSLASGLLTIVRSGRGMGGMGGARDTCTYIQLMYAYIVTHVSYCFTSPLPPSLQRVTGLVGPWMVLHASSLRRTTLECYPWSL